jgi:hypothetical protein
MVFPFVAAAKASEKFGHSALVRGPKSDVLHGACRVATARRSGTQGCGQEYSLFVRGIIASDSVSRNHIIRPVLDVSYGKWRGNASLGAHRAPLQIDQFAKLFRSRASESNL